jgi:hypothetical protein
MAISSDVKLRIFNKALYHLGSRALASLTENREPRRALQEMWGANNEAVVYALERGDWNFAMRSSKLLPEIGVTTDFGPSLVYLKPTDFARLNGISYDENFGITLTASQYKDEGPYWVTDYEPIYVRYVSKDPDYGFNSGQWSQAFIEYVAAYLAFNACERITKSTSLRDYIGGIMMRELSNAKSRDAMDEGTKFPQSGHWSRSRSRSGSNRDMGKRGNLIG